MEAIWNVFPEIREFLGRTEAVLSCLHPKEYKKSRVTQTLSDVAEGFSRAVSLKIPAWTERNPRLRQHILKVLICIQLDSDFKQMPQSDQNILLWSGLLHDIVKRQSPDVKGKDSLHPFTCCAESLLVFQRLGVISLDEDLLSHVYSFILSCKVLRKGREFMDPSKLDEILTKLYFAFGLIPDVLAEWESYSAISKDAPVLESLLIILFHQSFSVTKRYRAVSPISESQLLRYFTVRLLKLLHVLMKNDSFSYLFMNPKKKLVLGEEIDLEFYLLHQKLV